MDARTYKEKGKRGDKLSKKLLRIYPLKKYGRPYVDVVISKS